MSRDLSTCKYCKFVHHYVIEYHEKPDIYECRINPPVIIGNPRDYCSGWPGVAPNDWCGKWEP